MPEYHHYAYRDQDLGPPVLPDDVLILDWIKYFREYLEITLTPDPMTFRKMMDWLLARQTQLRELSKKYPDLDAFRYDGRRWPHMLKAFVKLEPILGADSPLWKNPTLELIKEGRAATTELYEIQKKYASCSVTIDAYASDLFPRALDFQEAKLSGHELPSAEYLQAQINQLKQYNGAYMSQVDGRIEGGSRPSVVMEPAVFPVLSIPLHARDCENLGEGPDHYFGGGVLRILPTTNCEDPVVLVEIVSKGGFSGLHPHISREGEICWGTASEIVPNCITQGDLIPLVHLVDQQFIGFYNWDTAFWNPDDEDQDYNEEYEEEYEEEPIPLEETIPF